MVLHCDADVFRSEHDVSRDVRAAGNGARGVRVSELVDEERVDRIGCGVRDSGIGGSVDGSLFWEHVDARRVGIVVFDVFIGYGGYDVPIAFSLAIPVAFSYAHSFEGAYVSDSVPDDAFPDAITHARAYDGTDGIAYVADASSYEFGVRDGNVERDPDSHHHRFRSDGRISDLVQTRRTLNISANETGVLGGGCETDCGAVCGAVCGVVCGVVCEVVLAAADLRFLKKGFDAYMDVV